MTTQETPEPTKASDTIGKAVKIVSETVTDNAGKAAKLVAENYVTKKAFELPVLKELKGTKRVAAGAVKGVLKVKQGKDTVDLVQGTVKGLIGRYQAISVSNKIKRLSESDELPSKELVIETLKAVHDSKMSPVALEKLIEELNKKEENSEEKTE